MLEGFWVRNFRSLRQVGIGTCYGRFVFIEDETNLLPYELTPVTVFVGANGSGKTTVIDAVNFVSDCYRYGADVAVLKRGGYDTIYSQGSSGPITIGFRYRQKDEVDVVTYAISIDCTKNKVPYIAAEILAYQRGSESVPVFFLQNGAKTIRYLAQDERLSNADLTKIEFTDYNHLGLAALESHPKYPVVHSLRHFFETWTLCHFTPDPARGLDKLLPRRQESPRGVSLSGFVRYIVERYKNSVKQLLNRVAQAMPGVEKIFIDETDPSKPLVSFQMDDRDVPVPISYISAGRIRLFTHLLFLMEESSAPLAAFEEPENGLDKHHRTAFVDAVLEFEKSASSGQVFINTHHPAVVNMMQPRQVWVFEKDRDGFTAVERASDSFFLDSDTPYTPDWFSVNFDEKR
ncbi:ATPase [Planctomycetales bacterium]|nr:ATPase [Planctomycetales bacterium]